MFEGTKLYLAPMAELTTPALRQCIKEFSEEVVLFSEMLSAGAIAANAIHNAPLIDMRSFDDPLIYQIVGDNPDTMARAAAILSNMGCAGIDINMGCPAPDIVKKNQGARLLKDMNMARAIVSACRKSTSKKLSVKMRSGYETSDPDYLIIFAKMLVSEGVDFITLHPRHAKLSFTRSADWSLVKLLKQNISIPVIGNGDITDSETAQKRLTETSCDGIMIGREAVKRPWIFHLIQKHLDGNCLATEIDTEEVFIKTLERIKEYLPENLHRSRSHRFSFYFCKNFMFGHGLFTAIRHTDTIDGITHLVREFYKRNPEERIKIY